jgi:hypothetical protein
LYPEKILWLNWINNFETDSGGAALLISGGFQYNSALWSGVLVQDTSLLQVVNKTILSNVTRISSITGNMTIDQQAFSINLWLPLLKAVNTFDVIKVIDVTSLIGSQTTETSMETIILLIALPIVGGIGFGVVVLLFYCCLQQYRRETPESRIIREIKFDIIDNTTEKENERLIRKPSPSARFSLNRFITGKFESSPSNTSSENISSLRSLSINMYKPAFVDECKGGFLATAKYDFTAKEEGELSFKRNDTILVVDSTDDVWWLGIINEKGGVFPASYVRKA